MQYTVVDLNPIKKEVNITVEPDEVNASIAGSATLCKNSVNIDGFRKGKAPLSVVEKKFHDHIYNEARENLINVHINEIFQKLGQKPLSGIIIHGDDQPLVKNQGYNYSMEFEILPDAELPPYEGIKVEEAKTVMDDSALQAVFQRIQNDYARIVPAPGNGPAKDGQIVNIDFEAFDDGKPINDLKTTGFDLELGLGHALPAFEALVKKIPVGHTAEEIIEFPTDFLDPSIAGKSLNMRVTVHSIKDKELPPLDDSLAKRAGIESLDKFKDLLTKSYLKSLKQMNEGSAQRKLLDEILQKADFPVPQCLIDLEKRMILTDVAVQLERQGKGLNSLGKTLDELMQDVEPQAEKMARSQTLLLMIARRENLSVTDDELTRDIYRNCIIRGEDFKSTFENLEKNGMLEHLRDRMLADKAMNLIYSKADVTLVEPDMKDSQDGEHTPAETDPENPESEKNAEKEDNGQPEDKQDDQEANQQKDQEGI